MYYTNTIEFVYSGQSEGLELELPIAQIVQVWNLSSIVQRVQ